MLARLGLAAVAVLAAAALLLLSAYAYLQTETGRAWVAERLNRQLDIPGGPRIRIGRLAGELPGLIEIHDLTVADAAGTWLSLELARARWRPWALLRGAVQVDNLTGRGLVVRRAPEGGSAAGEFRWPALPVSIRVSRLVLADALLEAPVLGERVAFRAAGDTSVEGPDQIRTRLEVVRTDSISGRAHAELTFKPRSKHVRFAMRLNESGGGVMARIMNLEGLPALSVRADGEGPLDTITGDAAGRAGDLASFAARYTVDATRSRSIEADGTVRIAGLVGPSWRDLFAGDLAFQVHGALTDDGVRVRRGTIRGDAGRVELSGTLSEYAVEADLHLAVDDLRPLAAPAGLPFQGSADLHASVRGDDFRKRLTAATRAAIAEALPAENPLHALTGARVDLTGDLVLEPGRALDLRDLTVASPAVDGSGSASLVLEDMAIRADFRAGVPRLAGLSNLAGRALEGSVEIAGQMAGPVTDPALVLRLSSPGLSVDGFPVGPARGAMTIPRVAHALEGDAELNVEQAPMGAVRVAAGFSVDAGDTLRLDGLQVVARESEITGTLAIRLDEGTLSGRLAGETIALAPWSDVAGRELAGTVSLEAELSDEGGQRLHARIGARGVQVALAPEKALRVRALEGSAQLQTPFTAPRGELRVDASGATLGDTRVVSADLAIRLEEAGRGSARGRVRGDRPGEFQVAATGTYAVRDEGLAVTVADLEGFLEKQPFTLTAPATVTHGTGTTTVSRTTLALAGGHLSVAARVDERHMDGRLEFDGMALERIRESLPMPAITGTLSGYARVSGPRTSPTGELLIETDDVRTAHTALTVTTPSAARVRGEWRAGRLRIDGYVAEVADNRVEARASLPLLPDPERLVPTVPESGDLEGELRWTGELGPLWDMLSPYEDRLSGPGELALDLTGTVGAPRVSGHFQILDGKYENVVSGTNLVGVHVRVVGSDDKLVLERLQAGDGKKGTLTGGGSILLRPAESYPTNLSLSFSELLMVARDDLILLANGDLALDGTFTSVLLSGRIETGSSELSLAGTLPPDVVELQVEEVNVEGAERERKDRSGEPSVVILDLDLVVPGRAFVRGLGLDSEWAGELSISGDAKAPYVSGVLSPVRGHFALLGKRFDLEKGTIRFTGSDAVDPLLDLSAERRTSSLTAIVTVTGSVSNPKVTLTSRPPLPESEIASQVLFGTDSQSLTPGQSLQLASAIAAYSGKGGAAGILDATRRALGVDAINFAESKEDPDKTRVSVGKYVTEGVYIELERGTEEDSRTATTVEVEVLPDVRLEGGTTEQGGNKVGVKWKWDY